MTGDQTPAKVLVLGVGNPLMRDDGIGPRVAEKLLAGYRFPDNVEIADVGTMSYLILDLVRNADHLVIVDAMRNTGHPAGSVMRLTPAEIAPTQVPHSMHDVSLLNVLQTAEFMGHAPEAVAIGIQIDSVEECMLELSPAVDAAVPIAVAAVLDELARLGVAATPDPTANVHAQVVEAIRSYNPIDTHAALNDLDTADTDGGTTGTST